MGETNRERLGELLDNISGNQKHENNQQGIENNAGSGTFQLQVTFSRETDYDTTWDPVTDVQLFDKTLRITDRETQGLTRPITDPRNIGRFATILKTLNFSDPINAEVSGTSISQVTNQVDRFLEESEITPDTPQLQSLKFHASILETTGIPWSITEIKAKNTGENHLSGEPHSMVKTFLEIGIPSSETGKTRFAEGVREASQTPFEKEKAGYVRSSIEDSGYTFYPLINTSVSYPGVLTSPTSPGGGGSWIKGYIHKGIIKSSFPGQ